MRWVGGRPLTRRVPAKRPRHRRAEGEGEGAGGERERHVGAEASGADAEDRVGCRGTCARGRNEMQDSSVITKQTRNASGTVATLLSRKSNILSS